MAERKASPHNWETERSLLGGLLIDPDALAEVRERVDADDFHRPAHAVLYRLLCELSDARQKPDITLVLDEMERRGISDSAGGVAYVVELPAACPSVANLDSYAARVHDHAVRRRLQLAAQAVIAEVQAGEKPTADLLDSAEQSIFAVSKLSGPQDWHPLSEVVGEQIDIIRQRAENPGAVVGIPTGFVDLDRKLAGLHPGQLIILGARPAMGKTAFALNIALSAAQRGGVAVGIFSLEMSRQELVGRMLCSEARVDAGRVRTGQLDPDDDWRRLLDASERLHGLPIAIDDQSGLTVGQLRSKARRLKSLYPDLGLIVVDYLQLMQGTGGSKESREQVIANISRGMKILAKELQITVLALSQLNRGLESRTDKRPMASDLRESGAIEQDADVIMFIYRDEHYKPDTADKGIAEIIISKQRGGETGTVKLAFLGEFTLFQNLAARPDAGGGYL